MSKQYQFCPTCTSKLEVNHEGYLKCTGAECKFMFYNNPTPVVAAIVEYGENQVVLAHNALWPPKWYGLITGFLEEYEHPEYAVVREVKEELGLDAEVKELVGHYTFKRMNQLIIAYHVVATGEIQLNEELDDYILVPFDKAKTWRAGTGKALRDFLVKRGYSPGEISFT